MDFIEKLFGLSPDNGDGSTEIMWLVALAAVLVAAIVVVRRRQSRIAIIGTKR